MTWQEKIYAQHVGKKLILDANLLLVLLIGIFNVGWLGKFKRVVGYSGQDYDLLVQFLAAFPTLLTTPHILAEVSNLAGGLPETVRRDCFGTFSALLQSKIGAIRLHERWSNAEELATHAEFIPFGITDAALSAVSAEALILTDDYRLSGWLAQRGASVLNFRDLLDIRQKSRSRSR